MLIATITPSFSSLYPDGIRDESLTMDLSEALTLFDLSLPLTTAQVRQRYRQRVKVEHPDIARHQGHQRFLQLQAAYQLLLKQAEHPEPVPKPTNAAVTNPSPQKTYTEIRVKLSAQQAQQGGKHTLTLTWPAECHRCRGHAAKKVACPQCQGTGKKMMHQNITVTLPKGLSHGSQLRLAKQGIPDANGQSSDLLITFDVDHQKAPPAPSPAMWTREVTLTLWQALLGDTLTVQTPKGPVEWRVPEGIQPGATIRFPRRGEQPGSDWFITVHLALPKKLTPVMRQHLEACRPK